MERLRFLIPKPLRNYKRRCEIVPLNNMARVIASIMCKQALSIQACDKKEAGNWMHLKPGEHGLTSRVAKRNSNVPHLVNWKIFSVPIKSTGWPGCTFCGKMGLEASWPTKWDWGRPCKPSLFFGISDAFPAAALRLHLQIHV